MKEIDYRHYCTGVLSRLIVSILLPWNISFQAAQSHGMLLGNLAVESLS